MEKFNTYLNIKEMREVVIEEDYPYTNLPELPLCKKLIIRNANVKTIESQPNCYDVDIKSCLPENKGQLQQIGDLPVCTSLSVYASKLKQIGQITNCEQLRLVNTHNRKPIIDISSEITILKDSDLNILYIAPKELSTKEVIDEMLDRGLPLFDIDFAQSQLHEHRNSNYINLKNIDFSGGHIRNVNFEWCDLRGATFDEAKLENVTFDKCLFDLTNFRRVDFSSCNARFCRFDRVNFDEANITPDIVKYLDASNVKGTTVTVEGNKLDFQEWQEGNKKGELYPVIDGNTSVIIYDYKGDVYCVGSGNMTFRDTILKLLLEKNEIIGLDFDNVTYNGNLELSDICFSGYTLTNCRISDCSFDCVSFIDSQLNNVIFQRCNFKSIDFSGLDLRNVYFSECQFSEYTLLQGCIISPQLACLLAEEPQIPALVKVQMQESEPITLEQFVSSVPPNNFDTLWDTQNLFLLLNVAETEIYFAGKEKDCYKELDILPMDHQYSVIKCDSYLRKRIHFAFGDYCRQILSYQNHTCNSDYNLANHLDVILTDIMTEALNSNYLNVLEECSGFINSSHEENLFYQSHCFQEKYKTLINLKMHIANQAHIPLSPGSEKKKGI